MSIELTQDYVKQLFEYCDGKLFWKEKIADKIKVGSEAGTNHAEYAQIRIHGKAYKTHRLIFLYHHGYVPKILDHIDENKFNNRIENLRECSVAENMRNCKLNGKRASTGHKNVSFDKRCNIYYVRIVVNGKLKNMGTFKNLELADLVAHEARDKYYGRFANHGY
jgi:hypothetical protein